MWTLLWKERVSRAVKTVQILVVVEDVQVVVKAAWKVIGWTVEISH